MGIIEDFNKLYRYLESFDLKFLLSCQSSVVITSLKQLQDRKTYFCCAVRESKCILHNCVVVVIGTYLDKVFRNNEPDHGFTGTFIIDGRHFSFPNILMNNNILLHNFFDKQYARNKNLRRMFLYGNYDDDKIINRAIQLVYDRGEDILYVRDVYAKDYVVDSGINSVLRQYLRCSGKWKNMDFVFDFDDYNDIFDKLKRIMSIDINYQIDSLSNKIIYKHSYLLKITYDNLLNIIDEDNNKKTIAFPAESKKIHDSIIAGKLIQSVSKTLCKQKKYDQDFNSNNNNLEVFPLDHRIGNEVLRIVNENLQQDMLKHTSDYVKFIDSFFHGEMTVAGKKFFVCHNVVLIDVDYTLVSDLFKKAIESNLFFKTCKHDNVYLISFNNRPTNLYCDKDDVCKIYYLMKRNFSPVEIKLTKDILFINHHEGMITLKKTVKICDKIMINTLQTPFEYHNSESIVRNFKMLNFVDEHDDTTSLMSTMIRTYYNGYLQIFNTVPVAKLIVSLTNLKNGMVVQCPTKIDNYDYLPLGNSVSVDPKLMFNNRMFYLWTLVRDSNLKTAEDPYIPHSNLPIRIYHNKLHKLKGKLETDHNASSVIYKNSYRNNIIDVEGDNRLCLFGVLLSSNKINWNHDGKKYKIEYCMSKGHHVYKIYLYFRKLLGQLVERVHSECQIEDGHVHLKICLVYSVSNLTGLKICGIHGQKGVLNESEDLTMYTADDDETVHAQICLSPISYISRQTNFDGIEHKYCTIKDKKYPLIKIPYMFFNNTPDNIYKEFIGKNITGYEKIEGTRLDQWSINQSFIGNRLSESLHCVRNGNNTLNESGQYKIFKSLVHCNNIIIDN
uniref:ORF107 protein n=1 Tax=Plutella xylostella granulovirus TaxID=98383 RepID=A0A7U3W5Y0_9BBAC|nr:ORF107 protein [Plutella xylostella granulovirus]